jgi:hypothetical protein
MNDLPRMHYKLDHETIKGHVGHNIVCVKYGNSFISLECDDCYKTLLDIDIPGATALESIMALEDRDIIFTLRGSKTPPKPKNPADKTIWDHLEDP